MKLALVGLPGAGKSTVGRGLARELRLPFSDADQVIEARVGTSIRTFFEQHGEAAFRELEQAVIAELCGGAAFVLSTGGGAVLRPGTRDRLRLLDHVVYLHATPEQLHARLRRDRSRPLLQVDDPRLKLQQLYQERDPLYRQVAHTVLGSDGVKVRDQVEAIARQLRSLPGCGGGGAP